MRHYNNATHHHPPHHNKTPSSSHERQCDRAEKSGREVAKASPPYATFAIVPQLNEKYVFFVSQFALANAHTHLHFEKQNSFKIIARWTSPLSFLWATN